MFGLSDPTLLHALSQKIQASIPTTLFYDPTGSPDIRTCLAGASIHPIHQPGLMHRKILILDEEKIFLGSTNFTTHSLKMHDNLLVGLVSRSIARFLQEKAPYTSGYMRSFVGGQDVEIWLLPDPRGHALTDLRKKIRHATHTLQIAIFTLTHPSLIEELTLASQRGVLVTVVLDMHSGLGASKRAVKALQKSKVRVLLSQGVQLLHHKFAYIDEKMLVMGSANWTQAAFTKNSDCLCILHHLNPEQKRCMHRLWRRIEANTTSCIPRTLDIP